MKRLALFMLALLVASRVEARDRRCRPNRLSRTMDCDSSAVFEAFPSSGAGTTTACSTTAPTGAKGEALTFTRLSSAVCTKTATGGLVTSGIADGDLVLLSSNVARVEYDSAGKLKLLVEGAATNLLLRSDALTNAAWSDVGTPTVTDGATDPFGGTTGDTIDDNDAAAFEGRSQSITVSSGAAYFMHCYVKAGTSAKARISIDGTTQDISGLSSSTWSIIEKGDASSSSTSISIQVLVGNAASDTGTVIWGGCDVKAGTARTSYAPTAGATATRAAEGGFFTVASMEVRSMAATVQTSGAFLSNARILAATNTTTTTFSMYVEGAGTSPMHALQFVNPSSKDFTGSNLSISATSRVAAWFIPSTTIGAVVNGTETTNSTAVLGAVTATRIYVSYEGGAGFELNGLIGEIQADPSATRAR